MITIKNWLVVAMSVVHSRVKMIGSVEPIINLKTKILRRIARLRKVAA